VAIMILKHWYKGFIEGFFLNIYLPNAIEAGLFVSIPICVNI